MDFLFALVLFACKENDRSTAAESIYYGGDIISIEGENAFLSNTKDQLNLN